MSHTEIAIVIAGFVALVSGIIAGILSGRAERDRAQLLSATALATKILIEMSERHEKKIKKIEKELEALRGGSTQK